MSIESEIRDTVKEVAKNEIKELMREAFDEYLAERAGMAIIRSKVLRVGDVAVVLGISKQMGYKLLEYGELKHVRVGRSIRISTENVQEYLEGRRIKAEQTSSFARKKRQNSAKLSCRHIPHEEDRQMRESSPWQSRSMSIINS